MEARASNSQDVRGGLFIAEGGGAEAVDILEKAFDVAA
jgi:hypothetical protein